MKTQRRILSMLILWVSCLQVGASTINLNGQWELIFDAEQVGETEEWFLAENYPTEKAISIKVPLSWETVRKDYEGVGWYRKTFTIAKELEGQSVRLHFGAVNYVAELYLNGHPIGVHEGGYDPFSFKIDDLLQFGAENTLIVRVVSPIITQAELVVDGMTKWEAPHWRGALVAGIWQDVELEVSGRLYADDLFVQAAVDGSVRIDSQLMNDAEEMIPAEMEYEVVECGSGNVVWSKKETRSLNPGKNSFIIAANVNSAALWSPDEPNLYRFKMTINQDSLFEQRFGFREFTSRDDGLYLNGKKFYMKAGFWEGLYPNGLAVPENREMVRTEIRLAKAAGFNTLRPWRKPPSPFILDLADEMGICMFGCPAVECMNEKPKVVPQMANRIFHEIESMVKRDRNHPSIICWELYNEIMREPLARIKHESVLRVRALDPTRLIIDESGGWANGAHAFVPGSRIGLPFNEIHSYLPAPVSQAIYDDYAHMGYSGYEKRWRQSGRSKIVPEAVTIVSEVGFGGFPDLESNMNDFKEKGNPLTPTWVSHEKLYTTLSTIMEPSGLKDVFGDIQSLCLASQQVQAEANKLQVEAIRTNPKVHGYCVHAYTAGDWVLGAGVLDMWRNPKKVYYTLTEANQPFYLSTRVEPQNAYMGQRVQMRILAINENRVKQGKAYISVKGKNGDTLFNQVIEVNAAQGISPVCSKALNLPDSFSGEAKLSVKFIGEDGFESENSYPFFVFNIPKVELTSPLIVIDPANKIMPFLDAQGVSYQEKLNTSSGALILTSVHDLKMADDIDLFRRVLAAVDQGARLIFFDPPATSGRFSPQKATFIKKQMNNRFFTENLLPEMVARNSEGRWCPVNHSVDNHPFFKGLPSGSFMGAVYQNIVAKNTLIGLTEKPVVSSVSWDYKRDHWAIMGAWWGSDLTVIPHGKGQIIFSTLRLLDHLGKDPVADRVFNNLIAEPWIRK